jgi:hypothetical protein
MTYLDSVDEHHVEEIAGKGGGHRQGNSSERSEDEKSGYEEREREGADLSRDL